MQVNYISPQEEIDKDSIKTDNLINILKTVTKEELDTYFENNLSALSHSTEEQINTYIDDIDDLPEAKETMRILAKDSAFNSNLIKKLSLVVGYLVRKI